MKPAATFAKSISGLIQQLHSIFRRFLIAMLARCILLCLTIGAMADFQTQIEQNNELLRQAEKTGDAATVQYYEDRGQQMVEAEIARFREEQRRRENRHEEQRSYGEQERARRQADITLSRPPSGYPMVTSSVHTLVCSL